VELGFTNTADKPRKQDTQKQDTMVYLGEIEEVIAVNMRVKNDAVWQLHREQTSLCC
jgi:hypothetical protein